VGTQETEAKHSPKYGEALLTPEYSFCPSCGAPFTTPNPDEPTAYCVRCGGSMPTQDHYCRACGQAAPGVEAPPIIVSPTTEKDPVQTVPWQIARTVSAPDSGDQLGKDLEQTLAPKFRGHTEVEISSQGLLPLYKKLMKRWGPEAVRGMLQHERVLTLRDLRIPEPSRRTVLKTFQELERELFGEVQLVEREKLLVKQGTGAVSDPDGAVLKFLTTPKVQQQDPPVRTARVPRGLYGYRH